MAHCSMPGCQTTAGCKCQPAFPAGLAQSPFYEGREPLHAGMSLRDYFAAQALAGILAGGYADTVPHDDVGGGREAAWFAYQYADAMLKAREGKS